MTSTVILCQLATLILLGSGSGSLPSEELRLKSSEVSITMRLPQTEVDLDDTIQVQVGIRNLDSLNSILLFDPAWYPTSPDSDCCYVIQAGGEWLVSLGYEQPVSLFSIAPSSEFIHTYEVPIRRLSLKQQRDCERRIFDDHAPVESRYIALSIAYLKDEKVLRGIDLTVIAQNGFEDQEQAFLFEKALKRILLGPVRLIAK
jgi:hypothetical protein